MTTDTAADPGLPPGPAEIRAAADRLAPWIHRTPVLTSRALDDRAGGSIFLKCENFQKIGAFKIRGATNAMLQLGPAERARGVVTHSSGNHGQAVAQAGRWLGMPVTVVMPRNAPTVKRAATEAYGATVVPCEPTQAAREAGVAEVIERDGSTLIHPFDDWRVIAGQATAALELIEQAGPLDRIVSPVGGGGLLAGTALSAAAFAPDARVIGAEPSGADDTFRSLASGSIQPSIDPRTVCDGLRTGIGARPFAAIRGRVDRIVTASDADILAAMRFVWERFKIIIEPSCAVAIAPLLDGTIDARGLRVGVIITGGNVDLSAFFDDLAAKWL